MRRVRALGSVVVPALVLTSACAPAPAPAVAPPTPVLASGIAPATTANDAAAAASGPATATASSWATATRSPWPLETERDPREAALAAACGADDGALARVAHDLVELRARGLGTPDAESLVARLRAAGQPYVRPRVIVATGQAPIDDTKVKSELAHRTNGSGAGKAPARCGVAIAKTPHGGEVLVALRVEALADLAPLPTRARTGEWLTFEARVYVPARSAKLVVLGPHGAPRTVPTSLDVSNGIARARFALDQPGAFTVQLVGDVAEGPRPLLEARIFADVAPTPLGEESPAPGEDDPAALAAVAGARVAPESSSATTGEVLALDRMVTALRSFEGSPPLARDEKLDALARAHAERMRDRHSVAHDLGDGDFKDRFEAEGTLDARAVGENVAHAPTVALAHRALHASPSHRINLLRVDYTHMGIGVARAPDGSVYVCETFAATSRANRTSR
jgi:uncharacterized protein YkwD